MSWDDSGDDDWETAADDLDFLGDVLPSPAKEADAPKVATLDDSDEEEDAIDPTADQKVVPASQPKKEGKKKAPKVAKGKWGRTEKSAPDPMADLSPAERKRLLAEVQRESDVDMFKDMLGLDGDDAGADEEEEDLEQPDPEDVPVQKDALDDLPLKSQKNVIAMAHHVASRLRKHAKSFYYVSLLKEINRQLTEPLDAESAQSVNTALKVIVNAKIATERDKKKKKKPKKKTNRTRAKEDFVEDEYDDMYDAFA